MSQSLLGIIGLGNTGFSVARYLTRAKLDFIMLDTRLSPPNLAKFKEEFPNVDIFLGNCKDAPIHKLTKIITSPAVPHDAPLFKLIKDVEIIGDIELLAQNIGDTPVVAITGTNGKSTVTTLVGKILHEHGFKVAVAGNIGTPALDLLADNNAYDVWVLELSSFQLEYIKSLKPTIATILNITPDHIDVHESYENYIKAKQLIYTQAKTCLMCRDYKETAPMLIKPWQNLISFGLDAAQEPNWGIIKDKQETFLAYADNKLISTQQLKIYGSHNWQNVLAACAMTYQLGVSMDTMRRVLQSFPGLLHRTQNIRVLDDITWIDDSKGTNVGATISAINGIGPYIDGKIILIAGGQGKGADFNELKTSVGLYVKQVILIGEDAAKIANSLENIVDINFAKSLEEAVILAQKNAVAKDVVLLSPACASFDMFRDFNHRGDCFINLVQAL